jgi:hypothetical protein
MGSIKFASSPKNPMNPLPPRKKSPAELASLRQSLGIPPPPPDTPASCPLPLPGASAPLDGLPQHHLPGRLHPRAFRHPERSPQPPPAALWDAPAPDSTPPLPDVVALAAPQRPRPLHSLKKSELAAAPAAAPRAAAADSKLPLHRHGDDELAAARRRDALAVMSHGSYQLPRAAHPLLLALGYLLALGGAAAPAALDGLSRLTGSFALGLACGSGYHLLTATTLAALPLAAFIHTTKTLSRHHAAFIASIVFFALVFAVLHYFPQLRHAT